MQNLFVQSFQLAWNLRPESRVVPTLSELPGMAMCVTSAIKMTSEFTEKI